MYSLMDHPLHFVYAEKDGLNLTGNQGRVLLKNILGQILALKEDDADGYIRLINKIGFLLPVSSENYEAVDLKCLTEIVKRIKATISLMNAIDGKTAYEEIRMFNAMTFLLFRDPVKLALEAGTYETCPHALFSVMHNTIPTRDFRGNYDGLLDNGNFEVNDTVSSTGKAEVSRDALSGTGEAYPHRGLFRALAPIGHTSNRGGIAPPKASPVPRERNGGGVAIATEG